MVMTSRERRQSLTSNPRPPRAALTHEHLRDPDHVSPPETAPTTVLDLSVLPRVAALDDDPAAVASVTAILNQSGFEAFAFTDVQLLDEASGAGTFAAYVLDWYLGNTTAGAFIEGLRRRPASAQVPIFLLSGNLALGGVPTDEVLARTIERHRVQYRAKPYSGLKLAADLRLALRKPKA